MIGLTLRRAHLGDVAFVYHLSSDPSVRQNSLDTSTIKYVDHEKWFQDRCSQKDFFFFIVCFGETSVGQIRIQQIGSEGKISYSICPKHRGNNYGKQALVLAENELRSSSQIQTLTAMVKYENKASIHIFSSLGYQRQNLSEYLLFKKDIRL